MWLLQQVPCVVVVLWVALFSTGGVLILRRIYEGRMYDHALSSWIGDPLLLGLYCGIVAYISQEEAPTGWYTSWQWNLAILAITRIPGSWLTQFAINKDEKSKQWTYLPANLYHNLDVIPRLGYLVVSSLPMLVYGSYTLLQISAGSLVVIWFMLVVFDIKRDPTGIPLTK